MGVSAGKGFHFLMLRTKGPEVEFVAEVGESQNPGVGLHTGVAGPCCHAQLYLGAGDADLGSDACRTSSLPPIIFPA